MYATLTHAGTQNKKGKKTEEGDGEEVNISGNESADAEVPKKHSAAWAIELDNELKCDREGKDACEYGKCWKEDDPESTTGGKIHYPINPRDSSFWLLSLVSGTTF